MINDKAILVGVDGSHASYKATWWAANYAKHAGLTLQIVCAYSLPSYAAVSFDATYTAMGDDNAAHSDAQEILSKAKAIADEQVVGLALCWDKAYFPYRTDQYEGWNNYPGWGAINNSTWYTLRPID